jgi:hypothetical protein
MKHSKKNGEKAIITPSPVVSKPDFSRTYIKALPTQQLRQSLVTIYEHNQPLEELLSTCEAAFTLIRHSEMEVELRNAFWQLEKQFDFWKRLVE